MKCLNDRYKICLAEPNDAPQLLRIYENGEFKGDLSVLYTRRPDPFQSLLNEGEKVVIPIVRDLEQDVVVGMGACIIRKACINGELKNTGYLTGLKELPEYRKKVPAISQTYQYLHEHTREDVDLYYTTILKENTAIQKMLEKKRKNMPEYRRIGEYTVYCFRTGVKTRWAKSMKSRTNARKRGWYLEKGTLKELEGLEIWNPQSFNLSPVTTSLHGLRDEDVYLLKDKDGTVSAACALWDQRGWKQYIVTGYGGMFKWLKKLPLRFTGYPDLPEEGVPANYGAVSLLVVRDGNQEAAELLLRMVAEKATKHDFLMLGLFENNPLNATMKKIKSIKYQSILYTVHWEEDILCLTDMPVSLEVGLL